MLVPVYNPYVRTTLPLVLAFCAAGGMALARLPGRPDVDSRHNAASRVARLAPLTLAAIVVAVGFARHDTARWRASRDLPEAARQIRDIVGAGSRVIVIGEAALAFYLELEGVRAFKGFEYWETVVEAQAPVYVATGIYIQRAPTLRKNYALLADRLTPLAEFPFFPYNNRLLETFRPTDAMALLAERRPDYTLRLYRYVPDPNGRVPELAKQ